MISDAENYRPIRVVVVGHLDHGKSTLIGRIQHDLAGSEVVGEEPAPLGNPAFSVDQLREERDGKLTVETSRVFVEIDGKSIVLIDVPGHRELIRNMLTGTTQADAAVFVLAANEGMQDQSVRHAMLLDLLGVRSIVIAVNKMDRAAFNPEAYRKLADAAKRTFTRLGIESRAVVPICAAEGDGVMEHSDRMPWYEGRTLLEELARLKQVTRELGAVRFPIQDVYHCNGVPIAVGRLLTGRISPGDELRAVPHSAFCRIREIRRFPECTEPAETGESVGLVLDGTDPGRGTVLCSGKHLPTITQSFTGRIFWLAKEPLNVNDRLDFRCATQKTGVCVERIGQRIDTGSMEEVASGRELEHLMLGEILLATDEPVVLDSFSLCPGLGRFLLELRGVPVAAGVVVSGR